MALRIRVDFDDMTFGDLYSFVDLARASSIAPETKVPTYLANEQDPGPGGIDADMTPTSGVPVTLRRDEARELASLLDAVGGNDGDARNYLADLGRWRDRLAGLHGE